MIARIWCARATPDNWPAYEQHFKENVLPELRQIAGYLSANLLRREGGLQVEITVITFWDSWKAIDSFAGTDCESAVVAPNAAALLADYDRRVRHCEVAVSDTRPASAEPDAGSGAR
jgi:heme-degrading monooxygenase HmoA